MISRLDAESFQRCIVGGCVAVFPADTVYGLACDPGNRAAVRRLYALKGRPADKPAAVMFFRRDPALEAFPELGERTRAALEALLPGGVTVLLPNPARRFPLAAGPDPETIGLRVPALPPAAVALHSVRVPVLQSSANRSGEPDARTLDQVPAAIRRGADLVLDAGRLPGTPSTVVDLRRFEATGAWTIVRPGAVPAEVIAERIGEL
jgi:L-threonylcarbamoyladenylate synthase